MGHLISFLFFIISTASMWGHTFWSMCSWTRSQRLLLDRKSTTMYLHWFNAHMTDSHKTNTFPQSGLFSNLRCDTDSTQTNNHPRQFKAVSHTAPFLAPPLLKALTEHNYKLHWYVTQCCANICCFCLFVCFDSLYLSLTPSALQC